MMGWLRIALYAALVVCALAIGGWWHAQRSDSYRALDAMVRTHPAVASEVGTVTSIQLPFSGWRYDWTNTRLDPEYFVRVTGTDGSVNVRAGFRDGRISTASMSTEDGNVVPLLVPR